jgi:hypothetical protein
MQIVQPSKVESLDCQHRTDLEVLEAFNAALQASITKEFWQPPY